MWHNRHHHHGCGEGRGPRFGMRGGGEERARRFFDSGDLRLVLLALIAETPAHGYDLIRAVEDRVGGAYAPSPGVVYPTLTYLEEAGLIEAAPAEGTKRVFQATAAGRAHLEERRPQVDALLRRMEEVKQERERGDYTPVIRAMANLRTALRLRLAKGGITRETIANAAAAIDELAAKIDRA